MRRRDYLALAAAGLAAGCSGSGDTETVADNSGTETPTPDAGGSGGNEATPTEDSTATPTDEPTDTPTAEPTEEPTPTDTPTPAGEAQIEISEHELVVEEGEYTTTKYVAATVKNTGEAASGQVELTAQWYDSNGDYLDDSTEYLRSLDAGETWLARVRALGSNEEIDDYELNGEFDTQPPVPPSDVELVETERQANEDEVTIEGRVANNTGDTLDYIEAIGKLYDEDGRVLSSEFTNETDIPEGETWKFTIEWFSISRADSVADDQVLLGGSF